jgi:Smg protein
MTEKENLLEILLYLFETYSTAIDQHQANFDVIYQEMVKAGFSPQGVSRVLNWFWLPDQLSKTSSKEEVIQDSPYESRYSMHIYSREENSKITKEARGYLLYLERMHVITIALRELLIEQAMLSKVKVVNVEVMKWLLCKIVFDNQKHPMTQPLQLLTALILGGDPRVQH